MRRLTFVLASVVASVVGAATLGAQARHEVREVQGIRITEDERGLWARATFSADSAVKLALARVPGGRITEAELEEEDGRLVYSFDLKVQGKKGKAKVHVDARTGKVVKVEHEDG